MSPPDAYSLPRLCGVLNYETAISDCPDRTYVLKRSCAVLHRESKVSSDSLRLDSQAHSWPQRSFYVAELAIVEPVSLSQQREHVRRKYLFLGTQLNVGMRRPQICSIPMKAVAAEPAPLEISAFKSLLEFMIQKKVMGNGETN